ncbi:MAG: DUF1684 domain-containing protein [Nocardioidaceae bacterium]
MTPLDVLDWRRQVHRLYADVRSSGNPCDAHELWRVGRDALFAEHPASPIPPERRADFAGLTYAPYLPELRHSLTVDRDVEPQRWEVESSSDGVVPFELAGVLHVPDLGDLGVWWLDSYGGGVFVPVRDATAGRVTYGAGRYLIDTVKGADLGGDVRDGELVVDLNFAYNPSCAYNPLWSCPLAPPVNTVSVGLDAGELLAGS